MTAVAQVPDLGARMWRTAARGAALVGAAVIVGIVLLQVVNGTGVPSSGSPRGAGTTNTSAVGGTTTTAKLAGRNPADIKVAVYNASGISQAATTEANKLPRARLRHRRDDERAGSADRHDGGLQVRVQCRGRQSREGSGDRRDRLGVPEPGADHLEQR